MAYKDPEKKKQYDMAYREAHKAQRKAYRDTHKEESKAWREAHTEESKVWRDARKTCCKTRGQKYRRKIKQEVMTHYSILDYPICARCGVTDLDILCLDHINGDGAEQRRNNRQLCGSRFYPYLRKAGFPAGLQVLCYNCNMKKRMQEGK